ncbi:MAG: hypothetical protein BWY89_01929 [Bacteroidetes bacterium ADurb.BinA012]|nr:MAG: hypothetical protein BWY89_01929 [Bacteroidetes bacterium ADurb.BinA012]
MPVLLMRCKPGEEQQGNNGSHVGMQNVKSRHTVNPHHCGGCIANYTSAAACIACSYNGDNIPDVYPVFEYNQRYCPSYESSGNIIEE